MCNVVTFDINDFEKTTDNYNVKLYLKCTITWKNKKEVIVFTLC